MASVTQTVDNYFAGISQQPDLKKFPGQVKDIVNGIPDVVEGLYKRPGAKRIGTAPIANVQSNGSWFHYYRDETEGSYIGQIASDGKVRIWSCNDGTEKNVWYHTDNSAYDSGNSNHTSITSYLTPSGATATEDLQALTINDTTFLNNRSKVVATTGTTDTSSHTNEAYVELLRTENGRQYALNIFDSESNTTSLTRATEIRKTNDDLAIGGDTGTCRGIGTQVFYVSSADSYSSPLVDVENNSGTSYDAADNKNNLIFRITTLGQNSQISSSGSDIDSGDFACTYSVKVDLLHGGENWSDGDKVKVKMTTAKGGAGTGASNTDKVTYTVQVKDIETAVVKARLDGTTGKGLIRPRPTPFDADTAVTVDTILGGIRSEMSAKGTGLEKKIIGNGIYIYDNSIPFSIEIPEKDLMRVMHSTLNDVQDLPTQCRDGYIVKITNSASSDDDDYYLKFEGNDGLDGTGTWVECPAPGIVKSLDATTMPHVLQRQADGDFLVKKYTWADRTVGDDTTNPLPSFVGKKINRVLFFRNRLALIAGENVILSRPGELTTPSFFAKTALAVSAIDPIDISCSSTFPSDLFDGIETAAGLAVFSTNQQFLLSSDAEILNPDTAKLRSISTYNYNKDISPISLGTTVGYSDNSGKYTRFNEMANVAREQEPVVIETSKLVPTLLPKDIDLITNSRENQLILFGKTDSDIVYGYKYLNSGEKRAQQSWFKWKLNNPIKYHFIIDDEYFFLDSDNFLQKINLMQQDTDPSIDETVGSDTSNYLIHLDNWTTIYGGVYDPATQLTTFTDGTNGAITDWIDQVTTPNGSLVLVDIDSAATRVGRYATCTVVDGDDFTVPGDWSAKVRNVTVTNGGSGYTSAPTISIKGNKGAWTASTAYVTGDQVTNNDRLYILTSGNHTSSATGAPTHSSGTVTTGGGDWLFSGPQATGTATVVGGAVTAITITDAGYNYHSGATVTFDGGGGSGATATATVSPLSTSQLNIGYLYEYSVSFPRFYLTQSQGEQSRADVNSSLVVHRLKLNFGKSGLYETTLQRTGKDDYTEIYESTFADEYNVSDAPYVPEQIQTVPVYESNQNVNVILKSSHPAPATLHSMSWEGDYSPRNYRRV